MVAAVCCCRKAVRLADDGLYVILQDDVVLHYGHEQLEAAAAMRRG